MSKNSVKNCYSHAPPCYFHHLYTALESFWPQHQRELQKKYLVELMQLVFCGDNQCIESKEGNKADLTKHTSIIKAGYVIVTVLNLVILAQTFPRLEIRQMQSKRLCEKIGAA